MEIRVTRSYRDKTADMKLRNIGDVYDAAPGRAKELIDAKFAVENTAGDTEKPEKVAAQAVEKPEAPKKTKKTTEAQ